MVCSREQENRQMCVHPLCSLQALDDVNPPFQTGFTFHCFINRLMGLFVDEVSIHGREWDQQLKSRSQVLYQASDHGPELMQSSYLPTPWHDHLLPSILRNLTYRLVKSSWISNAETPDFQLSALEMGSVKYFWKSVHLRQWPILNSSNF